MRHHRHPHVVRQLGNRLIDVREDLVPERVRFARLFGGEFAFPRFSPLLRADVVQSSVRGHAVKPGPQVFVWPPARPHERLETLLGDILGVELFRRMRLHVAWTIGA